VVLIQENQFEYHFSSHLKPWVYYVTLSFTEVDIVDKIKWLIAHDHLHVHQQGVLRKIHSFNRLGFGAGVFGKSYLIREWLCQSDHASDQSIQIIDRTLWNPCFPLSFTEADIVDKIKWLIAHDHIAKRIAKNTENFSNSYLRLEDYYCYVATALDTITTLEVDSDVLYSYEPYLVKY